MAYQVLTMLAPVVPTGARSGIKMNGVKGVTIHNTDNWGKGAGAKSHASYLRNSGSKYQASWHYAVDDKYATNSVPESEVSWHAGDGMGDGNYHTISIEICVNPESDLLVATDNAAALTADILKRHGLGPDKVFRHYDWSGKICPSQIMRGKPYDWATFKAKVVAYYNGTNETVKPIEPEDNGDDKAIGVGSTVYFDGKSHCYTQSDGKGKAGSVPPAGKYEVTHYAPGTMYSIHIGSYGWVPAINCGLNPGADEKPEEKPSESIGVGSTVYFDGKSHCYAGSNGSGKGMVPPAGNYKVTHYNPGAAMPIHIGSYGWVPAANCGVKAPSKPAEKPSKPAKPSSSIGVGSTVYFDGKSACYAGSNGSGKGMVPPAGNYKVTHYNPGAAMPIHIGSYGWVPAANCGVSGGSPAKPSGSFGVGKTVYFDGKSRCYAGSNGSGAGATPPAGNYKITYYNKDGKMPIHIGSYGWVPAANCTLK